MIIQIFRNHSLSNLATRPSCLVAVALLVIVLLGSSLAFNLQPAYAFDESSHNAINDKALAGKGFSKDAQNKIKAENLKVDSSEGSALGIANKNYKPEHHFDRNPGTNNTDAFKNGAAYVRKKKQDAIDAINKCTLAGVEEALAHMGQALHAIQDFYAHSNYVNLSAGDQADLRKAFDDPNQAIPNTVKLTGYDPKAKTTGAAFNPAGDDYPHGLFWGRHKDSKPKTGPFGVDKTPGDGSKKITKGAVTKPAYEWAKEAAEKHTGEFIDEIKLAVGNVKWTAKFNNYIAVAFTPFDPYLDTALASFSAGGGILNNGVDTTLSVLPGVLSTTETFYSMSLPVNKVPPEHNKLPGGRTLLKVREFWRSDTDTPIPLNISIALTSAETAGIDVASIRVYRWNLYDQNNQGKWDQIQDYFIDHNNQIVFQTQGCSIYAIAGNPINTGFNSFLVSLVAILFISAGFLALYIHKRFRRKHLRFNSP